MEATGRRLQQTLHLFLHPMLTRTFETYLVGLSPDVREEELKYYPDNDKKLRYVSGMCVRPSFYLQ